MKKLISLSILLCTAAQILGNGIGQISNHSSDPVTVIFYNNYSPAKPGATATALGTSATTKIGEITVTGGNSTNLLAGTTQVEVYYDHGSNTTPLTAAITNVNTDYSINPASPVWFISQDK